MDELFEKYKNWIIVPIIIVVIVVVFRKVKAMTKIIDIINKLANRGEYTQRQLSAIDKIVIHHSATEMGRFTMYDFARWHIDPAGRLKAPRIAYHFGIEQDGKIYQSNKLEAWSWHAGNAEYNRTSIGIELNGNFMFETPTKEQLKSLKWLIKYLDKKLKRKLSIYGHKEVPGAATGCPGTNFDIDKFRNIA